MQRTIVLMAALAALLATARLGWWQLDRALHKRDAQAQFDARSAAPPLPAAQLASDAAGAMQQHHRATVLTGRWLDRHTVFLDNRPMAGRVGFIVVTPLQLADGSVVLVQRGWTPREVADRTRLPTLPTSPGEVEIVGRIAPPPGRLFEFDAGQPGAIRQNLDLEAFAREVGVPLKPLSVLQTADARDGLKRDWPKPAIDIHKHYGYAFQWFSLAALIAGLYVWFQLVKPRLRN